MRNKNLVLAIGILTAILLAGMFTTAKAQSDDPNILICPIEKTAQPKIGFINFLKIVNDTLQHPGRSCAEGRVYVQMVIKTDGTCDDMEIMRGVGKPFDEEVMRAVRNACNETIWIPAEVNEKPVSQRVVFGVKLSQSE